MRVLLAVAIVVGMPLYIGLTYPHEGCKIPLNEYLMECTNNG